MLKPRKKIKKQELKEDKLVLTYYKAREFVEKNRKILSYVLTGIIILVAGVIIYRNNVKAENERAEVLFSRIITYYDNGDYKTAIDGIPQRNIQGLKYIVENYGGTDAGEIATYYLANAYFMLGDYDNALKYFKKYDGNDKLLLSASLAGIASVYEIKGEYKKAGEYFEKASQKFKENILIPEYLYNAGRNYKLAGEREKALRMYERIKKEYPNFTKIRDVEIYIASLKNE
ncbi:Tetratricopeptide repeat-containing protein [Candidatus Kryptobacter tengchongensis]|uniref:Tetratricopeptide repeat-containing protein n=2 Tax=Kryptobacter tengchongensis TaxID=1643429 RepID=A0A656DDU1_KRYT1|nr:tetratricopeptide repeat protein [Candidatus Kryptobacter tengchongensis]CUS83895.1 Tetratricopeptide repeat-containing protein [Candidatus Kryptobacter tengchongensis]CUT01669.1 Tetratricopeptide repeat-containing protein [Candidatus Kryptobacter tengchongensis]CUU01873.1 Tetratricopeptide repeat-containing protein [Candidatus Kryptobacter tengchongensis]CUU08310.1 Tetratricopeptide repeat-containing protein [Candidatus Kryptobacter tengchongensis]